METRRIRLGELDVAYLMTGPAEGTLAVLLHGYPDTPWSWRRLPRYRHEERAVLGAPRHPLLYLYGADDGCVLPDLSALATEILPAGRVVPVAGAGHFLQVEAPEQVTAAVAGFLNATV